VILCLAGMTKLSSETGRAGRWAVIIGVASASNSRLLLRRRASRPKGTFCGARLTAKRFAE